MKKKIIYAFLTVILSISLFGGGYWYGQNNRPAIEKVAGLQNLEPGKDLAIDFNLFCDFG